MAASEVQNAPWTRKHDEPGVPFVPKARKIVYPSGLEDLIVLLKTRSSNERIRAAGSHWALSEAAVSDDIFVESHDPKNAFPAMGRSLYDVVPECLSAELIERLAAEHPDPYDVEHSSENVGFYPFHIETGKRVYQAYAEMDMGDDDNPRSLARLLADDPYRNPSYLGPWAFPTLGGAGGQTVFGALTTGTHGGDFRSPPIADSVLAMHLVTDGGKHFWIERPPAPGSAPMTDDGKLRALYGDTRFGGPGNFDIKRDEDLFNAVIMSVGRFGIVYSIVVGAVRQYSLHDERRLVTWQQVKRLIANQRGPLFNLPLGSTGRQKFLQVAVCLTTHDNFRKNLCGVTRRWNVPLAARPGSTVPVGRDERRGDLVDPSQPVDPLIMAPLFTIAGNSHTYQPDPAVPGSGAPPSFLERACSNGDFMMGITNVVSAEIRQFLATNSCPINGVIAKVAALSGIDTLTPLAKALAAILAALASFLTGLAPSGNRLGEVLDGLRQRLLNRPNPEERTAGVFAWQCIAYKLFESQQSNQDYEAISYAVMDGHDYLDKSCNVNVDSVEVFFDATDPMLIAFVDALIAFEARQEFSGRAFVGYASLRFTSATSALIGPERWPLTCVVEVAGLKDIAGSAQMVAFAETLARNRNFNGFLHWGQRNNSTWADIEHRFGDRADHRGGPLAAWRQALSSVTSNGRLDGCTTAFSRRTGLEVVQPVVGRVASEPPSPSKGDTVTVTWNCEDNPPQAEISIVIRAPDGTQTSAGPFPLTGQWSMVATQSGPYQLYLSASVATPTGGRTDIRELQVAVA